MCVCLCAHAYTKLSQPSHTAQSSSCELSLGLGQHAPLSQVGVQSVEDAELLLGLKHQQLLQHLAGVWASAKKNKIWKNSYRPRHSHENLFIHLFILQNVFLYICVFRKIFRDHYIKAAFKVRVT